MNNMDNEIKVNNTNNKDAVSKEKNEKITYVYPGTVFTAKNYDPFTKQVLSHPFVCVYDQALDAECQGETNVMALLITSNNKQFSRQIPVLKAKNPFLEKDSYAYCNNVYMFLKSDVHIIGQMDSDTFFQIIKKRQQILRSEDDQCVQALMNMKAYESKSRVRARAEKTISELSDNLEQEKSKNESLKKEQEKKKQTENRKNTNPNRSLNPNKPKDSKRNNRRYEERNNKPKNNNVKPQKTITESAPMKKNERLDGPVDVFSFEPEVDPNYKAPKSETEPVQLDMNNDASSKKNEEQLSSHKKRWHLTSSRNSSR